MDAVFIVCLLGARVTRYVFSRCGSFVLLVELGPVVQNIVSLTNSFSVVTISLLKKNEETLQKKKKVAAELPLPPVPV